MREWGTSEGTPFLFWHSVGPGGNGANLDVAARVLAGAGLRVVAPDAPGFGRSAPLPPERYEIDELARLLWDVADALGCERAVVSGHSWGGAVAVAAAALEPARTRATVLFDSGHCDYANWPGADLTATRAALVAAAGADNAELETWEQLLAVLREHDLDREWALVGWREAVEEGPAGAIRLRVDPSARGAALHALTHARPSAAWPVLAEAAIPTLLVLATEPAEVGEANERLLPLFLDAVPHATVLRPGCRHQVFADLGARSGELVLEWLQAQGIA